MTGAAAQSRTLPVTLTGTIEDRLRRLAAGEEDIGHWRAAAGHWARLADEAFLACVDLRDPGPASFGVRIGVKDTLDVAGFSTRLGLRTGEPTSV